MAYGKLRGREVFSAVAKGRVYAITCYTQNTNYGFRHIACVGVSDTTECRYVKNDIVAKACYWNRTWERFRYETVLRNAIKNIAPNKEVEEILHALLIDKVAQDEHERVEREVKAFSNAFNSLNQENKDRVKNLADKLPNGMITNEEEARMIQSYTTLLSVLQ